MKRTWCAVGAFEDTKSNVWRNALSIKEQGRVMSPPFSPQLTANKAMEPLVQLMQGTAFCQQHNWVWKRILQMLSKGLVHLALCIWPRKTLSFSGGSSGKEPICQCNAGEIRRRLIPVLGRFPGGGHGNSLQYSCLENLWTEEPGGLQRVGHDWSDLAHTYDFEQSNYWAWPRETMWW